MGSAKSSEDIQVNGSNLPGSLIECHSEIIALRRKVKDMTDMLAPTLSDKVALVAAHWGLTRQQASFVFVLASAKGRFVAHSHLRQRLPLHWESMDELADNHLKVLASLVRRKLGPVIENAWGVGYRLSDDHLRTQVLEVAAGRA